MRNLREDYRKRKAEKEAAKAAQTFEKEKSKHRAPDAITGEYNRLCMILGDKFYRKEILDAEMKQICTDLLKLNQEFDTSKKFHVEPQAPAPAPIENSEVLEGGASEQSC